MFKRKISCFIIFCSFINMVSISYAATNYNDQIQAGIHYKRLPDKIRSNQHIKQLTSKYANKVHVMMFFSYGCFVCRRLVQPFDNWATKQKKISSSILVKFRLVLTVGLENISPTLLYC